MMTKKHALAGRVFVQNRHETATVSTRLVRSAARCAMGPLARTHDVSVVIADGVTMRTLNKRFTGRSRTTDVLAFPMCGPEDDGRSRASRPPRLLGEVIVSPDEARKQCRRYSLTPAQELILYVIHGILHLRGYDDHAPEDRVAMRRAERRVMARVFPALGVRAAKNKVSLGTNGGYTA